MDPFHSLENFDDTLKNVAFEHSRAISKFNKSVTNFTPHILVVHMEIILLQASIKPKERN